jgi:hypothetical protein
MLPAVVGWSSILLPNKIYAIIGGMVFHFLKDIFPAFQLTVFSDIITKKVLACNIPTPNSGSSSIS